MQKKSSFSLLWVAVVVLVGGLLAYHYVIKPVMQRKATEAAVDEGCQAISEQFDAEKEEIVEDLSQILSKMDDLDADESLLRDQIEELRDTVQSEVK